jgi:hypothetical protein
MIENKEEPPQDGGSSLQQVVRLPMENLHTDIRGILRSGFSSPLKLFVTSQPLPGRGRLQNGDDPLAPAFLFVTAIDATQHVKKHLS